MAYYDTTWYCNAGNQSTTGYYAVALRPQNAAVTAGQLVRQFTAPAVGSERVFVCIIAGTTANTTDATWVLTRGAKTTDGTVTWMECTGIAAVNGDITNTVNWTAAKAIGVPALGTIIQRNNGASYQICTTAGTLGAAEPAFSDTAGVTTTETSATTVWTSLGVVGNFTGGQAPHARLTNVCTTNWFATGNTCYVGDNHAETQAAAMNIAPAGNLAVVGKILCHNHASSYPPSGLTTGATVSTTGANNLTITAGGVAIYIYGITFLAGSASNFGDMVFTTNIGWLYCDSCSFRLNTTFTAGSIHMNQFSSAGYLFWNNCTVYFGAVQQLMNFGDLFFIWQNTGPVLATGSSIPTSLFNVPSNGCISNVLLEALDLSQLAGTAFIGLMNVTQAVLIKDCKLNASMTLPTPSVPTHTIQLVRCDSGATAYKSSRYQYEGTETTETSITRVGGASDPTGQQQSRKIVTTANSSWLKPFKAEPYAIWNAVTGANVTVTVCGISQSGALPNNDDIWMDVEYLGSASSTLGTIVNTTKANLLAANAAVSSDSSSWNNASSGTIPTTFNPVDLSAITLSNGNLTATGTGQGGVRGLSGFTSGKYYFEYTCGAITSSNTGLGLGTAGAVLSTAGATALAIALFYKSGGVYVNNVVGAIVGALSSGNVIGIAVDFTAQLIWFRNGPSGSWNASAGTSNNPVTGVGGISLSALSGALYPFYASGVSGDAATANFGATAFTGVVPSGFTSGLLATSWSPFKLVATLSSPQPGFAGYLEVRVRAAKPSATYYLDPKIVLS